jgi:hypothetical protein
MTKVGLNRVAFSLIHKLSLDPKSISHDAMIEALMGQAGGSSDPRGAVVDLVDAIVLCAKFQALKNDRNDTYYKLASSCDISNAEDKKVSLGYLTKYDGYIADALDLVYTAIAKVTPKLGGDKSGRVMFRC